MEQWIRNLQRMLPGYKGYEARETRRDADKMLRVQVAKQFRDQQGDLNRLIQDMTKGGGLRYLDDLDRISTGIDRFVVKLETAPRGYAGWFEVITIDETDLDLLYQFDLRLANSAGLLAERISVVQRQFNEAGDVGAAIAELQSFVDDLNRQLDARTAFTAEGKRPDNPPMAEFGIGAGAAGMGTTPLVTPPATEPPVSAAADDEALPAEGRTVRLEQSAIPGETYDVPDDPPSSFETPDPSTNKP